MKELFTLYIKDKNRRTECKRPLGRPRRRWEDNIKLDIRETGFDGVTGFSWLRIGFSGEIL
jgi:hypothetical protein